MLTTGSVINFMFKPLGIDLFAGLGGWTEGLLAAGYDVIGFDIERHRYPRTVAHSNAGTKRPGMNWSDQSKRGAKDAMFNLPPEIVPDAEWVEYPAQLVIQDVLTLHGSQFRDATLIVASPPCQEYSYMAMPWRRAKTIAAEYRIGARDVKKLTALFDACFRIQREASEAAGRHIPMVVENVRGAIPWVGRSRWNYGSFHLWGDVPALMPMTKAIKNNGGSWFNIGSPGQKETNRNPVHELMGQKTAGHVNQRNGHSHTRYLTNQAEHDGVKQTGISGARANGKGDKWFQDGAATHGSKSSARKAASAAIAKIPFHLAHYIGMVYAPI